MKSKYCILLCYYRTCCLFPKQWSDFGLENITNLTEITRKITYPISISPRRFPRHHLNDCATHAPDVHAEGHLWFCIFSHYSLQYLQTSDNGSDILASYTIPVVKERWDTSGAIQCGVPFKESSVPPASWIRNKMPEQINEFTQKYDMEYKVVEEYYWKWRVVLLQWELNVHWV